jgi:flagellar motor switch protein FliN
MRIINRSSALHKNGESIDMNEPNSSESIQRPLTADEIEVQLRESRRSRSESRSGLQAYRPPTRDDQGHERSTSLNDDQQHIETDDEWEQELSLGVSVISDGETHAVDSLDRLAVSRQNDSSNGRGLGEKSADTAASSLASTGTFHTVRLPGQADDVELDVTLEIGRAAMNVEDMFQLREGSVVSLDRAVGDPIDILAKGRLVARGEVLVFGDQIGIRVCEVIGCCEPDRSLNTIG